MMEMMIEDIKFKFVDFKFRNKEFQVHPQPLIHSQGWLLQGLDDNKILLISSSCCHLFSTFNK
jgi:hypothetical protein